jgi:hypothetical protein
MRFLFEFGYILLSLLLLYNSPLLKNDKRQTYSFHSNVNIHNSFLFAQFKSENEIQNIPL